MEQVKLEQQDSLESLVPAGLQDLLVFQAQMDPLVHLVHQVLTDHQVPLAPTVSRAPKGLTEVLVPRGLRVLAGQRVLMAVLVLLEVRVLKDPMENQVHQALMAPPEDQAQLAPQDLQGSRVVRVTRALVVLLAQMVP